MEDMTINQETLIFECLHDDILPKLSCIMMGVQICEDTLFDDSAEVEKKLIKLHEIAQDYKNGLMELHSKEQSSNLEIESLEKAVRDLIDDLKVCSSLPIYINTNGTEDRISFQVKTHVYTVIREAMINALKHAKPEEAEINLHFKSDCVIASVADDGKGFVLESGLAKANSLNRQGLIGMKNTAHVLGGKLIIETAPGLGTKVTISAPYRERQEPVAWNVSSHRRS